MEQSMLKKKENFNAVDIAKFIFSFFIVSAHTFSAFFNSPILNSIINSVIIRLGVSFFFVSSGFFFFRGIVFENGRIKKCPENRAKLCSFLKRTLILYCVWTAIYMIWNIYVGVFQAKYGLVQVLTAYIPDFFLDGVSSHFWYIVFMIYAIVLLYLALRLVRIEIVGGIVGALFALFFYGYTYRGVFGLNFLRQFATSMMYIKADVLGMTINFFLLYIALGFLFIGLLCVKLRDKISLKSSGIITLIFFCISIAENLVITMVLGKESYSYTVFFVPIVFFGFIFLSKITIEVNTKFFSFFRKSSSFIYCVHFLVINILNHFTDMKYSGTITLFLLVSAISLVGAAVFVPLSNKIKFLKKLF